MLVFKQVINRKLRVLVIIVIIIITVIEEFNILLRTLIQSWSVFHPTRFHINSFLSRYRGE